MAGKYSRSLAKPQVSAGNKYGISLFLCGCITHCTGNTKNGEFSMCVAVPAEVIEIREGNIGLVDYGDLRQEVRLDLVDVKVGEFVLVHVGFAIQRLSREEGIETRDIFRQVYEALDT
jgi:hydrogenase expression/formation protein HypC